jgi:hypothetical protein
MLEIGRCLFFIRRHPGQRGSCSRWMFWRLCWNPVLVPACSARSIQVPHAKVKEQKLMDSTSVRDRGCHLRQGRKAKVTIHRSRSCRKFPWRVWSCIVVPDPEGAIKNKFKCATIRQGHLKDCCISRQSDVRILPHGLFLRKQIDSQVRRHSTSSKGPALPWPEIFMGAPLLPTLFQNKDEECGTSSGGTRCGQYIPCHKSNDLVGDEPLYINNGKLITAPKNRAPEDGGCTSPGEGGAGIMV